MADQRLEEYRSYYDARAERYAGNPLKKHSNEAERKLRDLMYRYDSFEEIGANLGGLNNDCAFAECRDQYEMESEYYESVKEPVHKKGADEILAELDKQTDVADMMTRILDISNENSIEIAADCTNGEALFENWRWLDNVDMYTNAVVPAKYKSVLLERADDAKRIIVENVELDENRIDKYYDGWKIKPELVREHRHRYYIPYSDEEIETHLKKFKEIANR